MGTPYSVSIGSSLMACLASRLFFLYLPFRRRLQIADRSAAIQWRGSPLVAGMWCSELRLRPVQECFSKEDIGGLNGPSHHRQAQGQRRRRKQPSPQRQKSLRGTLMVRGAEIGRAHV